MKRVPVIPTILVALAVAAMIALGVWQLRRMHEKEAMIARYAGAAGRPAVGFPRVPTDQALLFRRSEVFCLQPTGWRASAGRDRQGRSGYRHIADCRSGGAEGPGVAVDMGWSEHPDAPAGWRGGPVTGTIGPDRNGQVLLVSDTPAPGLAASAVPQVADIPNNHFAYAIQWFVFAGVAAAIYGLVLWRRRAPSRGPRS